MMPLAWTGHEQIKKGEWDVCVATADAYDFKNKVSKVGCANTAVCAIAGTLFALH